MRVSNILMSIAFLILWVAAGNANAERCQPNTIKTTIIANMKLLKVDTNNIEALLTLAECYLLKNDLKKSKKYVAEVLTLNSQSIDGLMYSGDIASRSENWNEAKTVYLRVLAINPGYAPAYQSISNVYMALGDGGAADQAFEQYKILSGIK